MNGLPFPSQYSLLCDKRSIVAATEEDIHLWKDSAVDNVELS